MALLTKVKVPLALEKADIICVRGANWLSRAIIRAEYGNSPPPDAVSHTGIIVGRGQKGDPLIVEALTKVEMHSVLDTLNGCEAAWALHCDGLTEWERAMMVAIAKGFVGHRYGYLDLLLQGADALSRTRWFTDHLAWSLNIWPICSFVSGEPYCKMLGADYWKLKDRDIKDRSLRPSDIMAYGDTHTALTLPFSWSKIQVAG